jgi:hypothetical protein
VGCSQQGTFGKMVWQMILYNQIKDTFTQEELEIINLRN